MKYVDVFDFAAEAIRVVKEIGQKDFPLYAARVAAPAAVNSQSSADAHSALIDTLARLAQDKSRCWVCGDPSNCCVEGACPYHLGAGAGLNANSQDSRPIL